MKTAPVPIGMLIPTARALFSGQLAEKIYIRELGYFSPAIYAREVGGRLYVLDGHHRLASSCIYGQDAWVNIAESYDDCAHADPTVRSILERQWVQVAQNADLIAPVSIDGMIDHDLCKRTIHGISLIMTENCYETGLLAGRRAIAAVEAWKRHIDGRR